MAGLVEPLSDIYNAGENIYIVAVTNMRLYPKEYLTKLEEKYHVLYQSNPSRPMTHTELVHNASIANAVLATYHDVFDKETIDKISERENCKVISVLSTGFENCDAEYAEEKGILVCNNPGKFVEGTADITLSLILSSTRNIYYSESRLRTDRYPVYFQTLGTSLAGKKLGLIGFGRIGQEVAKRAQAFGLEVSYNKRSRLSEDIERDLSVSFKELEKLLAESDIISLHLPVTPKTIRFIDAEKFSMMKKDAYFINTSRGKLVHEEALADAIESGHLAGCGLDVYEHEPLISPKLLEFERGVTLYPHIGGSTKEAYICSVESSIQCVEQAIEGKKAIPNAVNRPGWYKAIVDV